MLNIGAKVIGTVVMVELNDSIDDMVCVAIDGSDIDGEIRRCETDVKLGDTGTFIVSGFNDITEQYVLNTYDPLRENMPYRALVHRTIVYDNGTAICTIGQWYGNVCLDTATGDAEIVGVVRTPFGILPDTDRQFAPEWVYVYHDNKGGKKARKLARRHRMEKIFGEQPEDDELPF